MTVTRDQFSEGYTWDDWLEVVKERRDDWHSRFRHARLGELRADYQDVPTPRYVLCLVDEAGPDSVGTVPYIAKACEQIAAAGGVELRILPVRRDSHLLRQFQSHGKAEAPVCVVFDDDWVQVGRWGPRPQDAERLLRDRGDTLTPDELERELDGWYTRDGGRSTLREFLDALRGEAAHPWRAGKEQSQHLWKQRDRARERP